MNVGSVFSGCGGLDLGLEQTGHSIIWACESDKACRRILSRHWPDLTVYPDVRELDGGTPRVDLLAGGFPCQDLSYAGRGAGLDGERSGLWFAMADAVRLLRPRYVLIENVPGLATKMGGRAGESALGTVIADLAEAGYVGSWLRLRASDLGAPHRRERIFIVAADADRPRRGEYCGSGAASAQLGSIERGGREAAADASCRDGERVGLDKGLGGRPDGGVAWGAYEPAIRRWEHLLGRPAPRPTDDRGRLMPEFVEWMLGFPPNWTEGESRTARLRMLGNAVQVQCGELVGRMIQQPHQTGKPPKEVTA